ncbi:hypothetical protein [Verrucomicrobium sp. 3C]|uniref:hypothetical protein n=1 Tax=Verrucomicrobium sp. 3C TaxID=1134055 RepID=UPI00037B2BDD|nr:hypothetical protein [Verrucomicrobium sp. 3C]
MNSRPRLFLDLQDRAYRTLLRAGAGKDAALDLATEIAESVMVAVKAGLETEPEDYFRLLIEETLAGAEGQR